MRNVLKQISDGKFITGKSNLEFSCSRIELNVRPGEICEGRFHILCQDSVRTEGFLTSSDPRMECVNYSVSGLDTEIIYVFDASKCIAGEVVQGRFDIVTNHGEYSIYYSVSVQYPCLYAGDSQIHTLADFTDFAQTDWNMAVEAFYKPEFINLFDPTDEKRIDSYKAFSAVPGNAKNVDEFLVYLGKKNRVEYAVSQERISVSGVNKIRSNNVEEYTFDVLKNGWGYTDVEVECRGDFFFTNRTKLSADDFHGNICEVTVFVDLSECGGGNHFGSIVISYQNGCIEIPVEVYLNPLHRSRGKERSYKQIVGSITGEYVKYRLGISDKEKWLADTSEHLRKLEQIGRDDLLTQLFRAHFLIRDERLSEAGWELDHAADKLERELESTKGHSDELDFLYCYHSFLTTLINSDEQSSREVAASIKKIYSRSKNNWTIAWMYIEIESRFKDSDFKYDKYQKLFEHGVNSPVIYMEALSEVLDNPSNLRKMDAFAIRVINFGARNHVLTLPVVDKIVYLAARFKEYNKVLEHSLMDIYQDYSFDSVLQEICSLLIRNDSRDENALVWYSKGIEANLRLTNLYEYYIQSMSLEGLADIPKEVLLYFSYQPNIDYRHLAYLYHYMIYNRRAIPEIYEKNRQHIVNFAAKQIEQGRIDRHLAAIYDEVIDDDFIDRKLAVPLSELLFANWIKVQGVDAQFAYVYEWGLDTPVKYALHNGNGVVVIYGSKFSVILEDADGNRYMGSEYYSLEKLMLPGRYARHVARYVYDNPRFNLFLTNPYERPVEIDESNVGRVASLAESHMLNRNLRVRMAAAVIEYYDKTEDHLNLLHMLKILMHEADISDNGKVFHYLVIEKQLKTASVLLEKFGCGFCDLEDLANYILFALNDKAPAYDKGIMIAASYLLEKGEPGSEATEYIIDRFKGSSKSLRLIWKAAVKHGLDRRLLDEKLILQLLFSGAYVGECYDIFKDYVRAGGSLEVIEGFVEYSAFEYLIHDRIVDSSVFECVYDLNKHGEKLQTVTRIAFLKYYSEHPENLNNALRELVVKWIDEFVARRDIFGFFLNYRNGDAFPKGDLRDRLNAILEELADLSFVDYRSESGYAVKIHYCMDAAHDGNEEYVAEYMHDVCYGMCSKEFVLFFGENIQYYITEERENGPVLTHSGNLTKNDINGNLLNSEMEQINRLLVLSTMSDDEGLMTALNKYSLKKYYGENIFTLM